MTQSLQDIIDLALSEYRKGGVYEDWDSDSVEVLKRAIPRYMKIAAQATLDAVVPDKYPPDMTGDYPPRTLAGAFATGINKAIDDMQERGREFIDKSENI